MRVLIDLLRWAAECLMLLALYVLIGTVSTALSVLMAKCAEWLISLI